MPEAATVRVELGARGYDIHIGPGVLGRAGELISGLAPSRVFVLSHPTVMRLHGAALLASFGADRPEALLVPSGERAKTLRTAARLYDQLLSRGADRRSVLIAFGGGVTGDLGGFVAATYMRGIRFVQAPTTLLAQVDASVGGKVAVDHPRAKNLIGAFYQPQCVLADTRVLHTLPPREYRSGLAEVVKHGAIASAGFFAWLEQSVPAIRAHEDETLVPMVRRNCEIKAAVVSADERESGVRATLNFGHTVGHALESVAGYGALRHGEAVSIGMVVAARLSEALDLCSCEVGDQLESLLEELDLPARVLDLPAEAIVRAVRADKKTVAGIPQFVLIREIGRVEASHSVPESALRQALRAAGAREE